MNSFYRGGSNRFGGGRDSNRQDFGSDRQMHRATCAKCGNECEVPFKPTGERPVYCSNCFKGIRSSDPRRSDDRDSRGRRDNYSENRNDKESGDTGGQFKKQFESLNWKLDKILKILAPAAPPEVVKVEKVEHSSKLQSKHLTKQDSGVRNPESSRFNIGSDSPVKVVKPKKSIKSTKKEKPVVEKTNGNI